MKKYLIKQLIRQYHCYVVEAETAEEASLLVNSGQLQVDYDMDLEIMDEDITILEK